MTQEEPGAGLEFLVVGPEDRADHSLVGSLVYRGSPPSEPPAPPVEGDPLIRYLVRKDGRPASAAQVIPYPVLVRGREVLMGGVGGVGTLVEARRTGSAHLLISGLLQDIARRGFPLTCLYAYRETYYRRFGYELCGWRWEVKCPAGRLPKAKSSLPVRRIDPDKACEALNGCYTAFIKGLSGCHLRGEAGWANRMGQTPPVIYAVGDPVEGYLWGSFAAFWEDASIGEFVWTTPESYEALLGVIAGICSNKTGATWVEPPVSPLLYTRKDHAIDMSVHRPTMWRIASLQAAFDALRPQEPFSFRVSDHVVKENNGAWTASPEGLAPAQEADFSLDIRALTQALMGQPSLAELASLGRVQIHKETGFEAACRFFTPQNVVCMEFF